jgi:hypothetical protein
VAKPDLIELSSDWDTALLVAQRYTGINAKSNLGEYGTVLAKSVLAAVLLIANKQDRGYGWVRDVLLGGEYKALEVFVEEQDGIFAGSPLEHLKGVMRFGEETRSAIFSDAYAMFSRALLPLDARDPNIDD